MRHATNSPPTASIKLSPGHRSSKRTSCGARGREARKNASSRRLSEVNEIFAHHADAIGDIEQGLAGEDIALDHYLSRIPGDDRYSPKGKLPGEAVVPGDSSADNSQPWIAPVSRAGESGHEHAAQVVRHRLETVQAGNPKT